MTSGASTTIVYDDPAHDRASLEWLGNYDPVSVLASIGTDADGEVQILFKFGDDGKRPAPTIVNWARTVRDAHDFDVISLLDIGLDTTWDPMQSGNSLMDRSIAALLSVSRKANATWKEISEQAVDSLASVHTSKFVKGKKADKFNVEKLKGVFRQRETVKALMKSIASSEEGLVSRLSNHMHDLYENWIEGDPTHSYRVSGRLDRLDQFPGALDLAEALRSRVTSDFKIRSIQLLLATRNCETDPEYIGEIHREIYDEIPKAIGAEEAFPLLKQRAEDFARERDIDLDAFDVSMEHPLMGEMDKIQHAMQGLLINEVQGETKGNDDDNSADTESTATFRDEQQIMVDGLLPPHTWIEGWHFGVDDNETKPSIRAILSQIAAGSIDSPILHHGESGVTLLADIEPELLASMEQSFLVDLREEKKRAEKDVYDTIINAALSDPSLDLEKFAEPLARLNARHNSFHSFNAAMAEVWTGKIHAFEIEKSARQDYVEELKSYGGDVLERLVSSLAQHETTFTNPEEWAKLSKMTRTLEANHMDLLEQPMSTASIEALEQDRGDTQKHLDEGLRVEAASWARHEKEVQGSAVRSLAAHRTLKELRDQIVSTRSHEAEAGTETSNSTT